ncbi:solute carrier family 20 [Mucor ambiguus]|uniref:Phosphate transporter n=1 Tax=Mucor ambiguus TaxID=91626 RepID=A0A0C9LVL7_9FUNG|nr:solute carrier family 20 [Mucor ambiguus]
MMNPLDYTWLFGVTMVFAFADAYGIGANDVANSFATSVASGSLSLAQACIIACFTEFLGALLLGSHTADTIKGGILSVKRFETTPELLMLGMTCAIIGSSVWVLFATRNGWPVSTTHSIVGAICGVGIAAFGGSSITWGWSGLGQIITSWFLSPVFAGAVAAIIYSITKYGILRQKDSVKWAVRLIPVYFFFTTTIEAFYLIYKGAPGTQAAKMHVGVIVAIAFGIGAFFALFAIFFFCPWLKRRVVGREELRWYHIFVIPFLGPRPVIKTLPETKEAVHAETIASSSSSDNKEYAQETMDGQEITRIEEAQQTTETTQVAPQNLSWKDKILNVVLHGVRKDVRNLSNANVKSVHDAAEIYDSDVEYMFSFLQVITACMASFAHGSNDVSNAVGPLSAVFDIWQTAKVDVTGKVPVPIWILAYGGVAIDLGLATYGYNIMRVLGNNITLFTPTRGFSAELGAALTVLTCSKLGLPVSTTHCITGATAAIGLCNGKLSAVNWKMLAWCFFSWVLTLPIAGLIAGLLFSFAAYAPNMFASVAAGAAVTV